MRENNILRLKYHILLDILIFKHELKTPKSAFPSIFFLRLYKGYIRDSKRLFPHTLSETRSFIEKKDCAVTGVGVVERSGDRWMCHLYSFRLRFHWNAVVHVCGNRTKNRTPSGFSRSAKSAKNFHKPAKFFPLDLTWNARSRCFFGFQNFTTLDHWQSSNHRKNLNNHHT